MKQTQNTTIALAAATAALLSILGSTASAAIVSVEPYHAYSDTAQGAGTISPFSSVYGAISQQDPDGGVGETTSLHDFRGLAATPTPGQTYFFLEDFTDGQFDVPGVAVSASLGTFEPRTNDGRNGSNNGGANTDNVDEDDGANDNVGGTSRGSFRITGAHNIRFTFDDLALGTLATHVGIVRAESAAATLTAFDINDNVLDTVTATDGGHWAFNLANDHFIGISDVGGIAYVEVTGDGNNEYDHFQYGSLAGHVIPEPATGAMALIGLGVMAMRRRRG